MFDGILLLRVNELIDRSKWMRFNLDYARGRWTASFTHERGKIYGKATRTFPADAINEAYNQAELKSRHLVTS